MCREEGGAIANAAEFLQPFQCAFSTRSVSIYAVLGAANKGCGQGLVHDDVSLRDGDLHNDHRKRRHIDIEKPFLSACIYS